MKVSVAGEQFACSKAVRDADKATLYLDEGGTAVFSGAAPGRRGLFSRYDGGESVSVYEMAKLYYPRLWDQGRIEALTAAGRLTEEERKDIIENKS